MEGVPAYDLEATSASHSSLYSMMSSQMEVPPKHYFHSTSKITSQHDSSPSSLPSRHPFYQPHFATLELIEIHTSYAVHPNLPCSIHLEEARLPLAHGGSSTCSDVVASPRKKCCLCQDDAS
ncbi:hypothetical protein H5410_045131 [Solanum commersonii]|uniref:Uncharacterized protein n=1 Tax=Solanum commersonii TaxID=4109 RepID=A0A9J5X8Q0_SOLCO|nr:hypothetical protein H5410_045131 [Solanum commersonii]